MQVLLTGPFGTIGIRVLEQLLADGHSVRCFDLDTPANRQWHKQFADRIEMHWGDITSAAAVSRAVNGVDGIIHLAAIIPPVSELNPQLAEKVNVGGTRLIIEAASQQATKPVLVFPSSMSVHGNNPNREPPLTIDVPLKAEDNYAGHKIACEQLVRQSDIPWVIVRIAACSDPINEKQMDKQEMLKMVFRVDPQTRIEYLHSKDAAIALSNALQTPEALGQTFFLGSGKTSQLRWLEYMNISFEAMGIGKLPPEFFGNSPYYSDWLDTTEAERVLKFQRYGIEDYTRELKQHFRWQRRFTKPVAPLVRFFLGKLAARARAS